MNMNNNPTRDQLRKLLSSCNDNASDHKLYVDWTGNVLIVPWPTAASNSLERSMKFSFDAWLRGNDYVGPDAAADDEWVERLFRGLVHHWKSGSRHMQDYF